MKHFYIFLIVISNALYGCSNSDVEDIKATLVFEQDHVKIIESCYLIKDKKITDSSLVVPLLTHILDSRVSHSFSYYGQTPYQARVLALEVITGQKPPTKVTYKDDALVVDFYLDWALKQGLLKSKDEIDVIHPYVRDYCSSDDEKKSILNSDKVTWLAKYNWPKPSPKGIFHGENEKGQ